MKRSANARRFAVAAAMLLSIACGDSPSTPSVPDDVVATFSMDAQPIFPGFGPTYSLFGSIRVASGVTGDVTLQLLTVDVLDQSGRTFLSFAGFGFPQTIRQGAELGGSFATTSDRESTRAAGTTFVAHLTYARAGGSPRTAESRGPIVSRRPPA